MARLKNLSVFLPAYNEEANIVKTVDNVETNLKKAADNWEIIIVNDGSKDQTKQISEKLAVANKNIRVINHPVNRGYGAAFKSGLYGAKYDWVSFIDADGQFDYSEIGNFIEKQDATKADMVIGYYRKRRVPFIRKVNSYVWQTFVWMLFGLRVRDIDCGFKLISKKVIDSIPPLESERGAFVSSEFLIKSRRQKFKIVEIPVHHYPRKEGEATGAKLNVIIRSFVDLFRLWKKLK